MTAGGATLPASTRKEHEVAKEQTHRCPSPGCTIDVERGAFACRPHWFTLPGTLRNRINTAWAHREWGDWQDATAEARTILRQKAEVRG